MDLQFWIDHGDSLFHQIFMIVMGMLIGLAHLFDTTYHVVNIFVYFLLIPATYIYLISRKTTPWLNCISGIGFLTFIFFPNLRENCTILFNLSVDFLNWTAEIFNSNYIDMSVYICVVVCTLVYLILIPLTLPKKATKIIFISGTTCLVLYLLFVFPF